MSAKVGARVMQPDSAVQKASGQFVDLGDGLPEGISGINAMLNSMRPEVAAKLMTEFFNDLHVQPEGTQ